MKTVNALLTALIVAAIPLAFISCDDPIPAGLETSIRGLVTDSIKQHTVTGAKVIVWGCHVTFMRGKVCFDIVDSVRTDKQGRFAIKFVTEGNATEYQVAVFEDESFVNASRKEVRAGTRNVISLRVRELNHIKVHVQVENNPLGAIHLRTAGRNLATINQQTRDTVVYGRGLPMTENQLYFTVYDTSINNARRSIDIVSVDLRDTIHFVKKISNTKEWAIGQ